MNLNFTIKNISRFQLEDAKFKCTNCTFWLNQGSSGLNDRVTKSINIWELFKSKFFEIKNRNSNNRFIDSFSKSGGIIKAAFQQ